MAAFSEAATRQNVLRRVDLGGIGVRYKFSRGSILGLGVGKREVRQVGQKKAENGFTFFRKKKGVG